MNHRQDEVRQSTTLLFAVTCLLLLLANAASAEDPPREVSRALPRPSWQPVDAESVANKGKSISTPGSLIGTTISLGLIVGTLILAGRWLKRNGFQGPPVLPVEAFDVLGQRTIDPRTTVHLVRCGSRVLLLGTGAEGVRTLSEIDDSAEIEQLTKACRQLRTNPDRPCVETASSSPARIFRRALIGMLLLSLGLITAPLASAQDGRSTSVKNRPRIAHEVAPIRRDQHVQPAEMEQAPEPVSSAAAVISPSQWGISLKMLALMTVFSLAPSILMMTTCFVRFIVVLGLLRQALGTQQGLPNQVLTAICLFLTFLVMSPIWQRCYQDGIRPYTNPAADESSIDEATALSRTMAPVREFMSQQIDKAGNSDAVWMLLDFQRSTSGSASSFTGQGPQSYDDVPFTVLAPAYLLSELKVGFLIGFQLFLPFLIIDLMVATILTSLGMTQLPPAMISLPFKLLLFVLIDGWFLTVGMLLESVKVS